MAEFPWSELLQRHVKHARDCCGDAYGPSIDAVILFHQLEYLGELVGRSFEHLLEHTLTHTNERIAHMATELADLKAAVASNTSATQGAGALISQQRGTIDTQAARIKILEDQLANSGGGGDGGIVGVDPAELVPLTITLTEDDNALVDAMAPPAKPAT